MNEQQGKKGFYEIGQKLLSLFAFGPFRPGVNIALVAVAAVLAILVIEIIRPACNAPRVRTGDARTAPGSAAANRLKPLVRSSDWRAEHENPLHLGMLSVIEQECEKDERRCAELLRRYDEFFERHEGEIKELLK